MKTIKIILAFCFVITCFSSCKKMAKSFSKEIASETVEKSTKQVGEEVVYGVSEKAIKKMDVDELIEFIRKNSGPLANSFEKLDNSFQKTIKKAIDEDMNFLNHLLCSNTLLDDFSSLVESSPNAKRNINLLKGYAKSTFDARRYGKQNYFNNISLKEIDGVTVFMNKADNLEYARMLDGIIEYTSKGPDANSIVKSSIINRELIPNCVYKIKGDNISYTINVDNFGMVSNIKFSGNLNDFNNVIKTNQNIFLGKDFDDFIKKASNEGPNVYSISFSYNGKDASPDFIHIKPHKGIKKQKASFRNINKMSEIVFSQADNKALIELYMKQIHISEQKAKDLIEAMNNNDGLAKLIHQNPEKNIPRWLNTQNPVDKSKLAVTSKGSYPKNAEIYAGNVYYFNPNLNPNLMERLKNSGGTAKIRDWDVLTYEDLLVLDNLYPDGVPFTKEGFPDFSKLATKDKNGKVISVDVGVIGNTNSDRKKAEGIFKDMGYKDEGGFTWHHVENSTSLIRVPSIVHALIDHAGGISMAKS